MATIKLDPDDLVPALVLALQHPDVRAALGARVDAPAAPRFLTPESYAARLQVSPRTVRKWAGRGMPVARVGGVVRVPVERADAWVESGGNVRAAVLRTLRQVAGGP
jgi:excisionase family DNA binding protein